MRRVLLVAVLFLLCSLALLFAAPASCWAAPTTTWYRVKHVTILNTDMSGSSGKYWTQQIGARVRPGSPTEGLASVTVTVDGVAHRNCSTRWPASDGTDDVCFCTAWDEPALPIGGPYTLVACDWNAAPSEAVTTPALTHFAEPAPEVTLPPPGGVVTSTAPSIDWVQFLGFEGENAPPVASQGVGVSGDLGCLWRQCDLAPGETSAQYGGADPLQPGQVYLARVWEFAPEVPLEGAAPGVYVEETGRVWAFVVYSPNPAINRVDICRGHWVAADDGDWYDEHVRTSVTDWDGWQDVSVTTVGPDGAPHPGAEDCDGSRNEGPHTLSQAWGAGAPAPLAEGSYEITAMDHSHEAAVTLTTAAVAGPPPVQDIISPANGGVIADTAPPRLCWCPARNAPTPDQFCVCVVDTADGSRLWLRTGIRGNQSQLAYNDDGLAGALIPGHVYELNVRAWYSDQDPNLADQVTVTPFTHRTIRFGVVSGPLPGPVPIEGKLLVDGWNAVTGNTGNYYMSGTSVDVFPAPAAGNADLSPLGDSIVYDGLWAGDPQVSALDLWKSDLDGSNAVNLTAVEHVGGVNCHARWSPDGSMVSWRHAELDPEHPDQPLCNRMHIWIANADGTGAHRLIPDDRGSWNAAWSPDGSGLLLDAVLSSGEGGIIVVRRDGTNSHRLPVPGCGEGFYSPDGSKVAFATCADTGTSWARSLWVSGADGSNARTVFENAVTYEDLDNYSVLHGGVMDRGGVMGRVGPLEWAWSPTGDRIAFLAAHPLAPDGPDVDLQREVWLCNLPSATLTRATDDLVAEWNLSWRGPNTQPGTNVAVPICNVTTRFPKVTAAGLTTSVVAITPAPPAGFIWIGDAYHIATTATVQGTVTMAIHYDRSLVPGGKDGRLALLHLVSGKWGDVTNQIDPKRSVVSGACPAPKASGGTTDLGIFAIAFKAK